MKFLCVIYVLSAFAFGGQYPRTMIKLAVRLQSPEVPGDSFAAKPKIMYRAGTRYCRTEEVPDPEHGIHGLMIFNEPDVWMVNLLGKTTQHYVDPGPTFNCRMPIFIAGLALQRHARTLLALCLCVTPALAGSPRVATPLPPPARSPSECPW